MHDPTRCSGWSSHSAMRNHLDDHCAGILSGSVPPEYLGEHDLEPCSVCGLLVRRFHNGSHPRCRPAARAACADRPPPRVGGPEAALPSFADILASGCSTVRHVPRVARAAWAQCLARAAASAVSRNTVAAWQEFMMLPQAVLVAPHRGGARHRAQAASATKRRCQRWLDGERMALWEELRAGPQRTAAILPSEQARHARCKRFAAEGDLSRACTALIDPPPLPASEDTLAELLSKHPQSAPPDLEALGAPRAAAVPEFSAENTARAIRSFRQGSAPGPSGLRPDHLREALLTAHADEVAAHLASLCHLLARGEAPGSLSPHLAGGSLHALPKPQGGVRPIAVGEVVRRLVGKVLCMSLREEARDYLQPLQLGVGVKAGTEAAVHASRQWLHRNAGHVDKVLVKLDLRNAFNSVDRAAVLSAVRSHLPEAACCADWCYGRSSRLRFGDHVVESAAGVQQGDPFGACVFRPGLAPCSVGRGLSWLAGPVLCLLG